jgi:hypothetical protein
LAEQLHKTVGEVEQMSATEFEYWKAFHRIRAEEA